MSPNKLSGADYFFLVIAHHIKKQGIKGLDCRYIMKLDGLLAEEKLRQAISDSPYFQLLARTRLQFKKVGIPRWRLADGEASSLVVVHKSESDEIPAAAFDTSIPLNGENLYQFDLVHHPTYSTVIFSWHHILLDAFGASQVLSSLNFPDKADTSNFFGNEVKESTRKQWTDLVIAKDFLRTITKDPLLQIQPNLENTKVSYLERRFSADETLVIRQHIKKYSRGGIETPYLLANMAIAYQKVLLQRGEKKKDIWVPIPMEQRKAGAIGPIISNWHSLLFFRIKANLLEDKKALVGDLSTQFFEQVKLGIPQKYANMLRLLRYLPIPFYYRLVKRPNGESLSGMLYSQSPSHESLNTLLGSKVLDITALPPNTTPPGISFQIATFEKRLKVVVQYSESCFNEAEIETILNTVEKELIGENA